MEGARFKCLNHQNLWKHFCRWWNCEPFRGNLTGGPEQSSNIPKTFVSLVTQNYFTSPTLDNMQCLRKGMDRCLTRDVLLDKLPHCFEGIAIQIWRSLTWCDSILPCIALPWTFYYAGPTNRANCQHDVLVDTSMQKSISFNFGFHDTCIFFPGVKNAVKAHEIVLLTPRKPKVRFFWGGADVTHDLLNSLMRILTSIQFKISIWTAVSYSSHA